eukprot:148990_1
MSILTLSLVFEFLIISNINAYNQHVASDKWFQYAKCQHLVNLVEQHPEMTTQNHWPECTIPCNAKGNNCKKILGDRYGPGNDYVSEKSDSCDGSNAIRQYWCYKSQTITKALKLATANAHNPQVSGTYWMGFLPDDKPLNEINLPGTHDTTAYASYLSKFTQTQDKNLQQQLDIGVRFLDLRIRWIPRKKKFVFAHGPTNFPFIPFEKALDIMISFLRFYDTETLIVSFWPEKHSMQWGQTKKITTKQFKKWLTNPNNPYKDWFYKFQWRDRKKTIRKMPTLGETRGKIVMMTIEMQKKGFEDVGKYSLVYGKDVRIPHKMWDKHVWQKKKLFHEWIKKEQKYNKIGAGNQFWGISSGGNGFLNFGFLTKAHPKSFADHVNPRIKRALFTGYDKLFAFTVANKVKKKRMFCGWLAFDFVDYQLAQFTVMTNKEIFAKIRDNCAAQETKMANAEGEFYNEQEWMSRKLREYDGNCDAGNSSYISSFAITIVVICCAICLAFLFGTICGFGVSKMLMKSKQIDNDNLGSFTVL